MPRRRTVTFVPTCIGNHGDVCVSCPRQKRFQDQEMDERVEMERTAALSWRARLGNLLRIRSNRVSTTSDNRESTSTVPAPAADIQSMRRKSNVDFPIQYIPKFETNEIRVTNEECTMDTEPPFILQPDVQARVPPSISAVSGRTLRSAVSQIVPNAENKFRTLFRVWDTRLSMKLFGSKNGIRKEEERRMNCKHWIIHPCSKFRVYWDLGMLVILMLNVILLPVAIAFFQDAVHPGWLTFNCISDFIFLLDIVLNFWTGVITDENTVILELSQVRKLYLRKWLILDIISIFPFDYIILIVFESNDSVQSQIVHASLALRLFRLVKLLSLLRLFRVVRFLHYLSKWEEIFKATRPMAPIINFVSAMLLLAHWNACIQFLVPYIQGFPDSSWVSINRLQDASVGSQYSWALFKAFSHMLCIGFGRFPPQNTTEVWLTIVSMLVGASLYAMFIGHISTLIHSVTSSTRSYNEKLKQVEEYMRYRKLPSPLKLEVHDYYYQRYRGHLFDEEQILNELSHALKENIVNYNCRDLVKIVPFFADADEVFITSVLTRLTFDVFLPGEYIIRCGAIGHKMYFILHGVVDIITSDDKVATSLCDGSYFGEICLLMKCKRVASVKAVTVCDLYSLSRDDFELVLEEFPHMRTFMETVAQQRLSMIKDTLVPSQADRSRSNSLGSYAVPPSPKTTLYVPQLTVIHSDPGDLV